MTNKPGEKPEYYPLDDAETLIMLTDLTELGYSEDRAVIAVKLTGNITRAIDWLEKNQGRSIEELEEELKQVEDRVRAEDPVYRQLAEGVEEVGEGGEEEEGRDDDDELERLIDALGETGNGSGEGSSRSEEKEVVGGSIGS